MKNIFILYLMLVGIQLSAQNFYDLGTVQTIEIEFAESNWDQLLDEHKNGDEDYIMAQSITINGEVLDSVGVKYKGNSTYSSNQTKNPFHIELDTYKEHDYQGYKDIKLSNAAKDPSFLREVLSYYVIRKYMVAPQSNYANVYVNGTLIGLYSSSEAINKTFVKNYFGSKKNTFVKCNPPAGAGPQSSSLPYLTYNGEDSTSYYAAYELKSDYGWDELIDLIDTLNNNIESIEEILDVDRTLWMLALDNVLVNLDSYIGQFAQNYYLYRDDFGRFNPVIWDLNESFGRFTSTGSGNFNSTTALQQMTPYLHENDANYPLVRKLLSIPSYKKKYLAHYKTILIEDFDNEDYYVKAQELYNTIDASVQADVNKFFTYANFQTNIDSDISSGGGGPMNSSTVGIKNLMSGRSAYLLGLNEFTATEPIISSISTSTTTPVINDYVDITAIITDAESAYVGYRINTEAPFVKMVMFDDGSHNDGTANDGVFGASIPVESSLVEYYIYAENSSIGKFSPQRAEYEYHRLTATTTVVEVGDLVINEFMASNDATVSDQDGEFDDWIELFNNTNSTMDISGYSITDDAEDPTQWVFPDGTEIAANGYLVIWADKDEEQEGLHAGFKLSASSETIFLYNTDGILLDEVSYDQQETDVSYGRYPNGTGSFQSLIATFNSENMLSTATIEVLNLVESLQLSPNPCLDNFLIEFNNINNEVLPLSIYDLQGKLMLQTQISSNITINTSKWHRGMYLVRLADSCTKLVKQ